MLFACAAIAATAWGLGAIRAKDSRDPTANSAPFSGFQYQLAFVGSSKCGVCNDPTLVPAVERIRAEFARQATVAQQSHSDVAVMVDRTPGPALRYLSRFSEFSEVDAGGYWQNPGLTHLRSLTTERVLGTPMLFLLRRPSDTDVGGRTVFGRDTILVGLIGLDEIRKYAAFLDSKQLTFRSSRDSTAKRDITTPNL